MTRDAEHTPTGYGDAASVVVNQAPAPSSLAGGAFDPQSVTLKWEKVETAALEEWRAEFGDYVALVTLGHDNVWAHRVNNSGRLHYKTADEAKAAALADFQGRLSIRLHAARKTVALYDAALSPEAPARGGVSGADMLTMTCFANNHDNPKAWAAWSRIRAALTPRHEAPAEGAGEREGQDAVVRVSAVASGAQVDQVYGGEWCLDPAIEFRSDLIKVLALRARSSAPEAREEALGNLLAVIHGDGGHRAMEVGTKQAALEAEKIVAGLFAAPSADKLRIAVEALEPFANLGVSSGPDDEPCHYAYRITRGAIRNARQALAALKAEGA